MNPLIERLGWTLIHSLWEGMLAWLGLRLALVALHRRSAQARYFAGCAALALAIVAPWLTFFRLAAVAARVSLPGTATRLAPGLGMAQAPQVGRVLAGSHVWLDIVQRDLAVLAPWLVLAWMLGCAWASLRLVLGWRAARRLAAAPFRPLLESIQQRGVSLAARLGIRRVVRFGESLLVEVPSVIGWLKPVILVPAGAFTGLSASQVDALLGHELAHVLRHDFLVNLLQSVCDVVFFYHPAILAINRSICAERENACDDIAVALTGDPVGYAAALARLEEARGPVLALAATGDGHLLGRVRRLLGRSPARGRPVPTAAWVAFAGVCFYLAAVVVTPRLLAQLSAQESTGTATTGVSGTAVTAGTKTAEAHPPGNARAASGKSRPMPKMVYEAMAAVLCERPLTVVASNSVVDSSIRSQFDMGTYVQDILSEKVRQLVIDSYSPEELKLLRGPFAESDDASNIFGTTTVEYDTSTRVIYVFSRHLDPKAAALIANRYVSEFIDYLQRSVGADNDIAVKYLHERSEQLLRESEAANRALEDFERAPAGDQAASKDRAEKKLLLANAAVTARLNYEKILLYAKRAQETKLGARIPLKQIITAGAPKE
jgi:Zn-dependent protease with chaperone function